MNDELIPPDGLEDGAVVELQTHTVNEYAPALEIIAVDDLGSIRTYNRKPILTTDAKPLQAGAWSPGIRILLMYNYDLDAFIVTGLSGVSRDEIMRTASNFDNPVYMSGCRIETQFLGDTVTTETAWKGEEIFAVRTTTETDSDTITEETIFHLDSGTIGVLVTTAFGNDGNITETVEPLIFEGVAV